MTSKAAAAGQAHGEFIRNNVSTGAKQVQVAARAVKDYAAGLFGALSHGASRPVAKRVARRTR